VAIHAMTFCRLARTVAISWAEFPPKELGRARDAKTVLYGRAPPNEEDFHDVQNSQTKYDGGSGNPPT
jgi:hypothetical protein